MHPELEGRPCPMCGAKSLVPGLVNRLFFRFVQSVKRPYVPYRIQWFACAECGFVGHRLPNRQLKDLRAKVG